MMPGTQWQWGSCSVTPKRVSEMVQLVQDRVSVSVPAVVTCRPKIIDCQIKNSRDVGHKFRKTDFTHFPNV
jgi:hypothetical protein